MKQNVVMKDIITELSTANSGFYGVKFGPLSEPYITLYKERFTILGFDAKTCTKIFGFIHRATAIVIEISCQTLKVNFFSKGCAEGKEFAISLNETDHVTKTMSTQDALIMIKREILSNGMDKILALPSRRRKALCAMLGLISDHHVTKYKIGSRYSLVKHRGRFRLYLGEAIAADVNYIEELTKEMFGKLIPSHA